MVRTHGGLKNGFCTVSLASFELIAHKFPAAKKLSSNPVVRTRGGPNSGLGPGPEALRPGAWGALLRRLFGMRLIANIVMSSNCGASAAKASIWSKTCAISSVAPRCGTHGRWR